jgi:hypothetical protein
MGHASSFPGGERMFRTDEDLEAVARNFLKKIGLEYQVRPDMMTIISKLKHIHFQAQTHRANLYVSARARR